MMLQMRLSGLSWGSRDHLPRLKDKVELYRGRTTNGKMWQQRFVQAHHCVALTGPSLCRISQTSISPRRPGMVSPAMRKCCAALS